MTKLEKWQAEAAVQGWSFVAQIDANYATYTHNFCGHEKQISFVNMRKGRVRCRYCMEKVWQTEASQQGWSFVTKVNKSCALYVHNVCGHKQQFSPAAMRLGRVRCHHCTEQAWRDEATAQGWTLERNIDGRHGTYMHNVCGHEQQVSLSCMRIGQVRCQHCMEQTWRNDAVTKGWTFERNIDGKYGVYVHDTCGHNQQIILHNMREGRVRCENCKNQMWQAEARAQGWAFGRKVDASNGVYTHSCGHEQKVSSRGMRTGQVVCHGCGESWATKPSNVYLLDITTACGQRFLKLGMARIVTRRAQNYGLAEGAKIKVLYAKAYATGDEACKVEKKLHKNATKIHPSIRKFKGAKKLMDSGYTECYEYSQEAVNYLLFALQF
jgi:hypothetical protein